MNTHNDTHRRMNIIKLCRILGLIVFVLSIIGGIIRPEHASASFTNAFTCALFFLLSYLPNILNSRFKLHIPETLQVIIVVFIFFAEILGEVSGFYDIFPWWDVMLHTCSGLIIGYIGFLIIYSLNDDENVKINMSLLGVAFFAFCFAIAAGALWEIFEWSGDMLLGMNMQKGLMNPDIAELTKHINRHGRFMDPGLVDTMQDLIVDAIGALVSSVAGYFTLRKRSEKVRTDNSRVK